MDVPSYPPEWKWHHRNGNVEDWIVALPVTCLVPLLFRSSSFLALSLCLYLYLVHCPSLSLSLYLHTNSWLIKYEYSAKRNSGRLTPCKKYRTQQRDGTRGSQKRTRQRSSSSSSGGGFLSLFGPCETCWERGGGAKHALLLTPDLDEVPASDDPVECRPCVALDTVWRLFPTRPS
jgi:hypothetical protein